MNTTERINELKRLYRKRHPEVSDSGGEGNTSGNWGGGGTVGTEEKGKSLGRWWILETLELKSGSKVQIVKK